MNHRIRAHLKAGGVLAYPTESCYGLGCDPMNRRAVERILSIKGRPRHKGLILIGASLRQLTPFIAEIPDASRLEKYWPGPFTLLFRPSRRTPKWLTGRHDRIALRLTAHPESARLCRSAGSALVSTSANRSGMKPVKSYRECIARFGRKVLVIPGRIGKRKNPSTILDFESGRIFRP
ncbi:MAG: L-threonylcarbamoyladenylate synthase [Burkholderiales bacterium]|nr:L-threonylcarbamoyladenylate synthase [Burkholderiales bacterium]